MRVLLICTLLISSILSDAAVRLPKLISDGMVLQRNTNLVFWGWADPGENVIIEFVGKKYSSITNAQGEWKLTAAPANAGGPYTITIKGKNQITLRDVYIGDVWLCSGQSNMELEMERVKYRYAEEIAMANFNAIRQFTVPDRYDFHQPKKDFDEGSWIPATSAYIKRFSAVAYFFAKEIHSRYKIPVGIINAALGGSPAEAWMSETAIKKFPDSYAELHRFKNDQLIVDIEDKDRKTSNDWYSILNKNDQGLKEKWASAVTDTREWTEFDLPGYWPTRDNKPINGVCWFRKTIDVPSSMVGIPSKLELGRIVDADSVFVNGIFVGTTSYQYPPRRYELKQNILKEGNNEIVIRVVSNSGRAGFVPDKPYELTTLKDTIKLIGKWKFRWGAEAEPLPAQIFVRWKPVGLFNSMIAPLANYRIKGITWYQGESNTGSPKGYQLKMETLIEDWRSLWNNPALPFIFVQLTNFMEQSTGPTESNWAELRNEQFNTLKVPNTGMAIAIDLGDWNDIHPENKKEVGYRLSLEARRIAYSEKALLSTGPIFQKASVRKDSIVLQFKFTGKGLKAKDGGSLNEFVIAGSDKKYYAAEARIRNNQVIVFSKEVANPKYVRYAWANNPSKANLCNSVGLPASPFSTEPAE